MSDEERAARKRARNAAWRKANPEKMAQYTAKWEKNNPAKVVKKRAKWRKANPGYHAEWCQNSPEKAAQYTAKWHKANPEKVRCGQLRVKYGISLDRYNAILESQGFRCSMCPTPHTEDHKLHVDHCHDTGRVRGLLCGKCNPGIGLLNHDINTLNAAIAYLQKDIDWREVV